MICFVFVTLLCALFVTSHAQLTADECIQCTMQVGAALTSAGGRARLSFSAAGLELVHDGAVVWTAAAAGRLVCRFTRFARIARNAACAALSACAYSNRFVVQSDGNLVIYGASNNVLWTGAVHRPNFTPAGLRSPAGFCRHCDLRSPPTDARSRRRLSAWPVSTFVASRRQRSAARRRQHAALGD